MAAWSAGSAAISKETTLYVWIYIKESSLYGNSTIFSAFAGFLANFRKKRVFSKNPLILKKKCFLKKSQKSQFSPIKFQKNSVFSA